MNIMHLTHMFNAMRPLHHREPGVVGAGLIHREISCEFIGDGVHTNPNLIRLLMQNKTADKLVLVTDALKYARPRRRRMPIFTLTDVSSARPTM